MYYLANGRFSLRPYFIEEARTMQQNLHVSIPAINTPGTAGGPGDRDRTVAVKSRKIAQKSSFFRKKNKIT